MEVWQISILKRFHWPIWHTFLKKSSQDSGNHQKERGERHVSYCQWFRFVKKIVKGQALAIKFHQQEHQNKWAKLCLSWPSTFPTADLHCTVHKERLGLRYWRVSPCGIDWGLWGRETVPMVRQNLPIFYSVSKYVKVSRQRTVSKSLVKFFAERPSDLTLIWM